MWPFTKKLDPRVNHNFTADDAELSLKVRQLKAKERELEFERRKMEHDVRMAELQQQLDDLRGVADDEPDAENNSTDAMMMMLMAKIFSPPGVPQATTPQAPIQEAELSDEQLREILDKVPKYYLKAARGMSDEALAGIIRGKLPGIGQDTINRAVLMVRG